MKKTLIGVAILSALFFNLLVAYAVCVPFTTHTYNAPHTTPKNNTGKVTYNPSEAIGTIHAEDSKIRCIKFPQPYARTHCYIVPSPETYVF